MTLTARIDRTAAATLAQLDAMEAKAARLRARADAAISAGAPARIVAFKDAFARMAEREHSQAVAAFLKAWDREHAHDATDPYPARNPQDMRDYGTDAQSRAANAATLRRFHKRLDARSRIV